MRKFNYYTSGTASSLLLAILVILSELSKPFKTFLASIFTHHWIAKLVIVAVVFILVGFYYDQKKLFGKNIEDVAWYSTLVSLAVIFLFYIIHFVA
jgi:hypothetical protein